MTTIRSSLVRLLRTPVKTAFFFLLLAFTVSLVCAGGNLWKLCGDNLERFEKIFTTIGTVEQTPERTEQEAVWFADEMGYRYFNRSVYGDIVSDSVLDFEGAGYLSGPEHRAYYEALPQDYELKEDYEGMTQAMIIEASPLEDCIPAGPVKIEVKRVLYSAYPVNVSPIYLCDHNTEHPQMLYADKTYLMALADGWTHDWEEKGSAAIFEYAPLEGPYSTQADADGNRLPTALTGNWIEELTPGFYETERGKAWLTLCRDYELRALYESFPVTATQDLNLIMAFYRKQAYLAEGELFSEEDYRQGNRVCLVPARFAKRNGLTVGDSLHLALRYANYAASANRGGGESRLNAEGEIYQVFEESDYVIKGIYDVGVASDEGDWGYLLERNEVFIPTASIKNSDENNIAAYGPMKGYTTAFRIPNGSESIENYKALWEAQGVDNVEITFYDGGYTRLEGGLKSMRNMSLILLATGIVSAVCIVIFFCHLFITKQKKRTAIERGLGMTKGQCVRSLLTGILVIALAGSAAGAFGGQVFAGRAAAGMEETELFDTRFSNGAVQLEQEREESDRAGADAGEESGSAGADETGEAAASERVYLTETDWRMSAVCGGGVFLFTIAAAMAGVCGNLKREPLALLSEAGK
ncbi:MAG: hypothetical protein K2K90_02975 [Lachnospiraceae bacterium]|nr:hypothetical protein [Lachnospiraceae bacterium]